jgi:hypothetical protein
MRRGIIVLAAAVLGLAALSAGAQEGGLPGGGPQGRPPMGQGMGMPQEHPMVSGRYADMLEMRLDLSSEQKAAVDQVLAGSKAGLKKKFDAVRKAHKELQALEKQVKSQIRETLTEKQKKSFDQMDQMRPGGPGPRGPRGGQQPQGEPGQDE